MLQNVDYYLSYRRNLEMLGTVSKVPQLKGGTTETCLMIPEL